MDNEEFRIKMDEINTLVNKEDYKAAMKIADGINWKKVKSAKTLSTVAEIYVKNKKYKEGMEIFLLAYHRAGIGKSILIRLIEISIAANSLSDAEDFFKEFRQIAPNDSTRYVLEYEILKAKNAPLSNQISVLERYNDREFTEKWSYELAKLYYQIGDEQNCIDTCNKMILWFYDGEYVMKAMELKKNLNALTEDEMIRYESSLESMSFTQEDKEALRENIEEESEEDKSEEKKEENKKEEKTTESKENQDDDLDDDELDDLEEEDKKGSRFKISFFGKKDKGNKKKRKSSEKKQKESDDDLLDDLDHLDDLDYLEDDKKEDTSDEESSEDKKEESEEKKEIVDEKSDVVTEDDKDVDKEKSEENQDVKEEVKEEIEEEIQPEKPKKKKSNIVRENFSDDDDEDDDEFDDFNEEEFIHELEGTSGRGSIGKDFQSKIARGLKDIFKGKKKGLSNNLLDEEDLSEQVITSGKPDDTEEVKKLEDDLDDLDDLDGIDLDRILKQELEEETEEVSDEKEDETGDTSEKVSEEIIEEEISEETEEESEEEAEESNHSPYSDDSLAIDINEIMEIMNDKKKEKEEAEEKKRKEEAEEAKEPEFNMEEMILSAATEQGIVIGVDKPKESLEEEIEEESEEEIEEESEEEIEEESEEEIEEESEEESEEEIEEESEEEIEEESEEEIEEESEKEIEEESEEEVEEESEEELEEELEEEFEDNESEEESEEEPDNKVKKNGLNLSILRRLNEKIGRKLSTKKVEKQEEPEEETASIKVPSVKDSVFQDVEKLEEESVIDNVFADYEDAEEEDTDLIEDTITLDVPKVTEEEIDEASEDEDSLYEQNEFEDNELGEIEEESEVEPEITFEVETNVESEIKEEVPESEESEEESEEIKPLEKESELEVDVLASEAVEEKETETDEMSEEQKLEMIMDYQSTAVEQRDFTEKEKEQFKYFVKVPGMKEQIIEMLSQVKENYEDKTSLTGNIIVMGAAETGKTSLISMMIPAICSELNMEATKVAYVFAEQINGKNIAKIVSKMSGGFLVIEEASKLDEKSVEELNKAMEFRTDGMIVILEDDKIKMRKFLVKYPEFAKKFNSILNIPVFTNEELVDFATYYTKENGFFIDQLGMVSLYKKINRSQKADEPLTVGNVEKLVQEAMDKAQKKKLFSKRKLTEDGMIILGEKDFN